MIEIVTGSQNSSKPRQNISEAPSGLTRLKSLVNVTANYIVFRGVPEKLFVDQKVILIPEIETGNQNSSKPRQNLRPLLGLTGLYSNRESRQCLLTTYDTTFSLLPEEVFVYIKSHYT